MHTEPNPPNKPDVDKIAEAVRHVDVTSTVAWERLSLLSENTQIESIEVFEDEIRFNGQDVEGPIVWHVTLNYGSGEDALAQSETFPGKFKGHLEGAEFQIDEVSAETSSFYA